jgi:hypothetical protein
VITLTAWCQITVKGTVILHDDGSTMPGVNVVEKGTTNGTTTQLDGSFSIDVTSTEATLQFSFIGVIPKEVPLKGRQDIQVSAKLDCNRDWFDIQRIGVYLNSGVIHDPAGGKLEIAFPVYIWQGVLTGSIGYQTDFHKNEFTNGDLKLKHFVFNCDFDIDAGWFYRQVKFDNTLNATGNSFETNVNFRKFGIVAGFSHLSFNNHELSDRHFYNGPVIGLRRWFDGLRLETSAKVAIYKGRQEYFAEVSRESRYIDVFVRYYRLNVFSELSLGVGTTFGYRFKTQRR